VAAARGALDGEWRALAATDRGLLVHRLAGLLEDHAEELAEIESLDNGKPLAAARTVDLPGAIACLRYFAGWPTKIEGETSPVAGPFHCYTRPEPVGVCGQIVPWNFPLVMAVWKIAPALAAGCTSVLKPAEQTPLSALRLAELALEAGIPPGVVNVVTGDGQTGAALVDHPGVAKIAFTGSTDVGRAIAAKAGSALKRVTLELGGKSPNVLLPDADLDAAIGGSYRAIYRNSGQTCNAGSRLLVHVDQFDAVVSELAVSARSARVGPGLDPETEIGPLVSAEQRERVERYVEAARSEGAELVAGGGRVAGEGFFVEPTLFSATRDDLAIAREEIFGPVLVASPYRSLDEVAARANDTPYGLAAGLWTLDVATAHTLAARLAAGSVYVNAWGRSTPPRRSAASRPRASGASTVAQASRRTSSERRCGSTSAAAIARRDPRAGPASTGLWTGDRLRTRSSDRRVSPVPAYRQPAMQLRERGQRSDDGLARDAEVDQARDLVDARPGERRRERGAPLHRPQQPRRAEVALERELEQLRTVERTEVVPLAPPEIDRRIEVLEERRPHERPHLLVRLADERVEHQGHLPGIRVEAVGPPRLAVGGDLRSDVLDALEQERRQHVQPARTRRLEALAGRPAGEPQVELGLHRSREGRDLDRSAVAVHALHRLAAPGGGEDVDRVGEVVPPLGVPVRREDEIVGHEAGRDADVDPSLRELVDDRPVLRDAEGVVER
jgi:acyl-CoA reductase-like NAD-dependent aldehyde dehydrogenase